MFYRQFLSQAEYDRIVHDDALFASGHAPHCNETVFHEPGVCAFCDGHYRRHPGFTPERYATPEANGWGGNMAPVVDDAKAGEEALAWQQVLQRLTDGRAAS